VIIKNDPPELIPNIENRTAYPITKTIRMIAVAIMRIPDRFELCIKRIDLLKPFLRAWSAMRAAGPTTGSALSFEKIFA